MHNFIWVFSTIKKLEKTNDKISRKDRWKDRRKDGWNDEPTLFYMIFLATLANCSKKKKKIDNMKFSKVLSSNE